jgi:PAT family beta-lactamase induction signal transducer AmpG
MRRLSVMLVLGFDSGLPLLLSGFTLRQFLTKAGVSPGVVGLTAYLGFCYTLKFLWAPVLDHIPPPGPLRRFGRRRGWMLLAQPLLALAIAALALTDAATAPLLAILVAAPVAFFSATQDIAIDAWRIETFPLDQQGIANAVYVWGYRVGMLAARSGVLFLAAFWGWRAAWLGAGALCAAGMLGTLVAPEPTVKLPYGEPGRALARVGRAMADSLRDFLSRAGAVPILLYVVLFNLGEGMAGVMLNSLYEALGFSNRAVAFAGPYSLVGSIAGITAGGLLVVRLGVARGLIATGFFQMAAMAMYIWLAVSPGNTNLLYATTAMESFAQGCATAAFLAYLSGLCSSAHTATQFAVLTSVAPLASYLVGGMSGFLAQAVGWPAFYLLAMLAALPGMVLMLFILGRYPLDWGAQARVSPAVSA